MAEKQPTRGLNGFIAAKFPHKDNSGLVMSFRSFYAQHKAKVGKDYGRALRWFMAGKDPGPPKKQAAQNQNPPETAAEPATSGKDGSK